jgi:hypothetical protein
MRFEVRALLVEQELIQFGVDVRSSFKRQSKLLSAYGQDIVPNPLIPLRISQFDVARIDFPCFPYRLYRPVLASKHAIRHIRGVILVPSMIVSEPLPNGAG